MSDESELRGDFHSEDAFCLVEVHLFMHRMTLWLFSVCTFVASL